MNPVPVRRAFPQVLSISLESGIRACNRRFMNYPG